MDREKSKKHKRPEPTSGTTMTRGEEWILFGPEALVKKISKILGAGTVKPWWKKGDR